MGFRVTQALSARAAQFNVQRSFARVFKSQQALASGKRIQKPSDDPSAISRLLFFKQRAKELDRFSANTSEGQTFVESAASNLQALSARVADVRERVVQGLNGALSTADRRTIANEIDGILQDIIALANSRIGERYLFGGTASDVQPFALLTDPSGQQRVVYQGNDDTLLAEIGPGVTAAFNVPGSKVFSSSPRGATKIDGSTGVQPGTGTDSGTGLDRLIVAHGQTTYAAGGLQSGLSGADDTALGNLTLGLSVDAAGTTGTITLNGGPPVAFVNPQTDLTVTGANGETLHIDTTSVTPGFVGVVAVTSSATYSLDGGATTTPVDFTATNQQIVDSFTGAVLNVDSTGVTTTGVEDVTFGSFNLFDSLIAIRDGLKTAGQGGGSLDQDIERVNGYLAQLDQGHDQLLEELGTLGGYSSRLQAGEQRLQDLDIRLRSIISKTEDVDLAEATTELQQNETAYQSALLITSRVNQLSLLNFL